MGLNIYMIGLEMHRRKAFESFCIDSVIPHKYPTVYLQLQVCLTEETKMELCLKCVNLTTLHRLLKNIFPDRHTAFIFLGNSETNILVLLPCRRDILNITMKIYKMFKWHAAPQSFQVQDITAQKDNHFVYVLHNFYGNCQ